MSATFAYDAVQYPGWIFPQMHPSRLAATGRLYGLATAAPTRCRLLEVGCGDALQLLSLALAYPQSEFIGVDLSHTAIERGEAMRQQLGLTNLQLHAADVCAWDSGTQPFDYVVAHGFFSWVPEPVQDTLLGLCQRMLADDGIAYISYNALPGCHIRRMLWGMLHQHTAGIEEPQQKIAHARNFLHWLGSTVTARTPYGDIVRHEAHDMLEKRDPSVFYHDDLAELNLPYSITEFTGRAKAYGLTFLAEADPQDSSTGALPEDTAESLAQLAGGDVIRREQYLDYLKGRRFRQSLLCRQEAHIQRPMNAARVLQLQAVGQLQEDLSFPASEAGQARPGLKRYCSSGGAALVTDSAAVGAALTRIGQAFPSAIPAQALLLACNHDVLDEVAQKDNQSALCNALLKAFEFGLLTLHCDPPRFAATPGERPLLNRLSRLQLEQGQDLLASLRPSLVRLDNALGLALVKLLDGTRDRAALLQALAQHMMSQPIPAQDGATEGEMVLQPLAWWLHQLDGQLDDGLRMIAHMALLDVQG